MQPECSLLHSQELNEDETFVVKIVAYWYVTLYSMLDRQ